MTSETQSVDELVMRPDGRGTLPSAGLRKSITDGLRRVTPSGPAVRWASRARDFPDDELAQARLTMEAIVAHTPRAGEVDELAVAFLREQAALEELFWRPWLLPKRRWTATDHRDAALADGVGVVFSYLHRGPFQAANGILGDQTPRIVGVTGDWMHTPPAPGLWGRRVALTKRTLARSGIGLISAAGSYQVLEALLLQGTPIIMAFDMPGSHRMQWLGKPVDISMSNARLAWSTGATIVPYWTSHEGAQHTGEFGAPLRPADHGSVEELQEALGAAHEPKVLEAPELMEDVRRPGAWTEATGDGWFRPQRG